MKRICVTLALALMVGLAQLPAAAWAIESGHDCAEGNDQDLEAEQQAPKPARPSTS